MKNTLFSYQAAKYFTTREHPESQKGEIKIVDPKQYIEFIKFVLGCRTSITPFYKLFIALQLTLGARVSELLDLTKDKIILKNGNYYARIKILKKRKKEKKSLVVWRLAPISNLTVPLLVEWLKGIGKEEKLFNLDRSAVYRKYMRLFGIHPHCLRHSMITYLIEVKGWTMQQIVKHYQFSEVKTALRYFNADQLQDAENLINDWDQEIASGE